MDLRTGEGEMIVIDMDAGKEELIIVIGVAPFEQARVVNAVGHAWLVQQELVILDVPVAVEVVVRGGELGNEKGKLRRLRIC